MKIRILLLALLAAILSCGPVKDRRTVKVPEAIREAKTATLPELIQRFNNQWAGIETLTVSKFSLELTGGSLDVGYFEDYRTARGYLLAADTGGIFVNILNPLTNSSVLTMASSGDEFQIWVPSENQYITGSTDVKLEEENPIYNIRPVHILDAILIERINPENPEKLLFLEEAQDAAAKYYVLTLVERPKPNERFAELSRKIWIERSQLQLARQEYYAGAKLRSVIIYGKPARLGNKWFFSEVTLERPQDHYSIRFDIESESVRLDRPVEAGDFDLPVPPGAEIIKVEDQTEKSY